MPAGSARSSLASSLAWKPDNSSESSSLAYAAGRAGLCYVTALERVYVGTATEENLGRLSPIVFPRSQSSPQHLILPLQPCHYIRPSPNRFFSQEAKSFCMISEKT